MTNSKRVLIVEDNELNMKLFHDLLEAVSYTHLDVYKRQLLISARR